jgi:hypothetical protein
MFSSGDDGCAKFAVEISELKLLNFKIDGLRKAFFVTSRKSLKPIANKPSVAKHNGELRVKRSSKTKMSTR